MDTEQEKQQPQGEKISLVYTLRYPFFILILIVILGTIILGYQSSREKQRAAITTLNTESTQEETPSKFTPTQGEASESAEATKTKEASPSSATTKPAISVKDNVPSYFIKIELAELVKPGFVVIFVDKRFSQEDLIGESQVLESGENANVSVRLTQSTKLDQTLYAVIYVDDGDEVFDFSKDTQAEDEEGNTIFGMFTIVDEQETQ